MPHPRVVARLRLLLNLLLFAAIIDEHRGGAAAVVVIDPELSSPSPFTIAPTASTPTPTPTPKYTATVAGENNNEDSSSSSSASGSVTPASNALDMNAYAVNGVSEDNNNMAAAVAGADETVETEGDYQLAAAAPTSPASVEQQDQPRVPPTVVL